VLSANFWITLESTFGTDCGSEEPARVFAATRISIQFRLVSEARTR
jgi:hypothetical protein